MYGPPSCRKRKMMVTVGLRKCIRPLLEWIAPGLDGMRCALLLYTCRVGKTTRMQSVSLDTQSQPAYCQKCYGSPGDAISGAKREAGPVTDGQTGAAPATVSEELQSAMSLPPAADGKTGLPQRSASQETCRNTRNVHGRGVPVGRLQALALRYFALPQSPDQNPPSRMKRIADVCLPRSSATYCRQAQRRNRAV